MRRIPIIAIALLCGIASANAQTNLRFAHTQPPSDTHHAAAEHFAERVSELTGGEITVTVHPAGELGSDPSILEGVRLGTIDIAQTGNPFYTRFEPKLNVLDLPYLFNDYAHAYSVVDGEIGDQLLGELEKHRMKGLAFWEIGFRKVTNSVRAVQTVDDLKGLKIRTTPNPAHIQAFEKWGAIPTPMAFTEVYLALETGAVDGQENPLNITRSNRFQEVQKHLSYTDHAYTASVVSMNLAKFNGLSEEHQKALLTAAKEAADFQRQRNRESEAADLAAIEEAGVQVVQDLDLAPFKDAVVEAGIESFAAEQGREIVDAIIAAQ
ncbi:DctP family TRAP transporter solute-binding subunit [Aurantimonas aggregata]|uniref:DctP family TRAP transporter solute-binding subunit n=1 Tax=Aurantimonas aggregata TaxID=2047720 RepID=A0A6L9MNL9_9HYPH|nr:TRAP transporter substrate-binding protein [Aurantimonas aggregata]NDV89100.1 DctP family TRAP transporter solute-binding subunit [Aurantimonas aggregata]